jgi:hypothetical protein
MVHAKLLTDKPDPMFAGPLQSRGQLVFVPTGKLYGDPEVIIIPL